MRRHVFSLVLSLATVFLAGAASAAEEPQDESPAPDAVPGVHIRILVNKDGERVPFTREVQTAGLEEGERLYTNVECVRPDLDVSNGVSRGSHHVNGRVGPDGVCTIPSGGLLTPGTYMIVGMNTEVTRRGKHGPHKKYYPVDGTFTFTVSDSGPTDLQVETVLGPDPICLEWKGKVITAHGVPVEGAVIEVSRAGPGDPNPTYSGPEGPEPLKVIPPEGGAKLSTNANGAFTLKASPSPWFVSVRKRGYNTATDVVFITPGSTTEIVLRRTRLRITRRHLIGAGLVVVPALAALSVVLLAKRSVRSRRRAVRP